MTKRSIHEGDILGERSSGLHSDGADASESPTADGAREMDVREREALEDLTRDISDVPAVEVISTAAVHLMSAAAVKIGLAQDPEQERDLDEARKLIEALAGLVIASAPAIGNLHARSMRDGLRTLQLAFREASLIPDARGEGPGEKLTGPVD